MQGAPNLEGELRPLQRASKTERNKDASPDTAGAPGQAPTDDTPVSSIMTARVVSFTADTPADQATRLMLEKGISGAPVVDEAGRPIGMVSKTDLLESLYESLKADTEEQANAALSERKVEQSSAVGDIMVPYLLAVSSRAPIALAAALMAYEGVHRLLVLDENNNMVGIVSSLDVLRWVAQLSGFCLPSHTRQQPKP